MGLNAVESPFMSGDAPLRPHRRARHSAVFIEERGLLLVKGLAGCEALRRLTGLGYRLIVIGSNDAGPMPGATGAGLQDLFADCGTLFGGYYVSRHAVAPSGRVSCLCRKPQPGLLHRAANELGLSLADSWLVGDVPDDIEAGHRAGCRTIQLANGHETQWQPGRYRSPHYLVHSLDDAARVIAESLLAPAASAAAPADAGVGVAMTEMSF